MKLRSQAPMLALLLSASIAPMSHAAPAKKPTTVPTKKPMTMPAVVRRSFPAGATSLFLGQLPMGAGGEPRLVHLWAAGRKRSPYTPHQFDPSPFCVDIFRMASKGEFESGQWQLVNSTVYLGEDGPAEKADGKKDVQSRWLQPAKKQAPVLVIVSPSYLSTRYTVITYPTGIESPGTDKSYVQEFFQGGLGGGKITYDFGVDKRGFMTVVGESSYPNTPDVNTVFSWNGREYKAEPAVPE